MILSACQHAITEIKLCIGHNETNQDTVPPYETEVDQKCDCHA